MRLSVALTGLATLTTCLFASPVSAQAVAGRLLDRTTARAIVGATVTLADSAGVRVAQAASDTSGEFYLALERAGSYRLHFSVGSDSLGASEPFVVGAADFFQRIYRLDVPRERVYFEFQVEKQVAPRPGNGGPRYPEELRQRSVEGEVLVQFVVDTTGRPLQGTIRVLRSTHEQFGRAAVEAIPRMWFYPAEFRGRKVKQLVQMPFEFRLGW